MTKNIVSTVLKAVGFAMGVAVIVLSTLNALNPSTAASLLGIGLTALGLASLRKE